MQLHSLDIYIRWTFTDVLLFHKYLLSPLYFIADMLF